MSAIYQALRCEVLIKVPEWDAEMFRFARAIAEDVGLPQDVARSILRDLRNSGLVILRPTCNDDGIPNGSGYQRTIKGDLAAASLPSGLLAIATERQRQFDVEGWTPEHDDAHDQCELALAGGVYALSGAADSELVNDARMRAIRELWPFQAHWFKPTGGRADLVRAGALIAAEIDRLDRTNG